MALRGIRGAITVDQNSKEAILKETTYLLQRLIQENELDISDIATVFFSVTTDLNAEFPAVAARKLGLTDTPLMCMTEIPVHESLQACIRILMQVNSEKLQKDMKHLYLKEAIALRPDTQAVSL